jgi:uncharacterized protein (TIGR01319 family)
VSESPLARAIRMPTPRAVLEATSVLATLGRRFARVLHPVVLDVGGATTDVHSCLSVDGRDRAFGAGAVPDQRLTRTVEGDLGLRENADSLVDEALRSGYVQGTVATRLRPAAALRRREHAYVATGQPEAAVDDELATLASALALARHAGALRVTLSPEGAALRKSGRDLRPMSCLIATGGVFEHSNDAGAIAASAVELARQRGALVPSAPPVVVDRSYVLSAAGLLSVSKPQLARALLVNELLSQDGAADE